VILSFFKIISILPSHLPQSLTSSLQLLLLFSSSALNSAFSKSKLKNSYPTCTTCLSVYNLLFVRPFLFDLSLAFSNQSTLRGGNGMLETLQVKSLLTLTLTLLSCDPFFLLRSLLFSSLLLYQIFSKQIGINQLLSKPVYLLREIFLHVLSFFNVFRFRREPRYYVNLGLSSSFYGPLSRAQGGSQRQLFLQCLATAGSQRRLKRLLADGIRGNGFLQSKFRDTPL